MNTLHILKHSKAASSFAASGLLRQFKTKYPTMASLPTSMKAIQQRDPQSWVLTPTETPLPEPNDLADHLIRVHAVSPCRGERSWTPMMTPERALNRVNCTDGSGTIVSAPEGSSFPVGTPVFLRMAPEGDGCLKEYTLASAAWMARKPERISWAEAASTPVSALTAWQGLFEHGTLDPKAFQGDNEARQKNSKLRVLVTGVGGGVGTWAVQLAVQAGAAAVVATCGSSKVAASRAAGATDVLDYTKTSLDDWVAEDPKGREFDLILDCVGGETLRKCWSAVKEGGTIIAITITPPDAVRPENAKSVAKAFWFMVQSKGDQLAEIAKLLEEGKVKPAMDSVFDFADFNKAFDKVEEGRPTGKVVISVSGE